MNGHRPRNLTSTTLLTRAVDSSRRRYSLMVVRLLCRTLRTIRAIVVLPCAESSVRASRKSAPMRGFFRCTADSAGELSHWRLSACRKSDKQCARVCTVPITHEVHDFRGTDRAEQAESHLRESRHEPTQSSTRPNVRAPSAEAAQRPSIHAAVFQQAVEQADMAISITDAQGEHPLRQSRLRRASPATRRTKRSARTSRMLSDQGHAAEVSTQRCGRPSAPASRGAAAWSIAARTAASTSPT